MLLPLPAGALILSICLGQSLTAPEVIRVTKLSLLLDDFAADRSRHAIRETLQIAVKIVHIIKDGREVETSVSAILAGDLVSVHTGEKIPADGNIVHGKALIDTAHITGRADPELHGPDDQVFAGSIFSEGYLQVRTEQVGAGTYVHRMMHLEERSRANRAPIEKYTDKLAVRLVNMGFLATAGTLAITGDL